MAGDTPLDCPEHVGVLVGAKVHLVVPLTFIGIGFQSPGADPGQEEIELYLKERSETLDSIGSVALLFLRTRAELEALDVEILQLVLPYGEHQRQARHGLALGVMVLRPRSRGSLTLRSADSADAPVLDPRYLSDQGGNDLL